VPKDFDSISDQLGFASGADAGHVVRFFRGTEFFFDGVRFNPGTYELRKVSDKNAMPSGETLF
jgi:hypothetical protein